MKLAEIFFGEVQAVDQLGDAVVNFLFYLRAQGVTKIKTEELIPMLKQEGINDFDWSDADNYNLEYGIEYDGKVYAESIELSHNNDLIEAIVAKVAEIFSEADAPEELDTTEPDNHPVENLQN